MGEMLLVAAIAQRPTKVDEAHVNLGRSKDKSEGHRTEISG
jgi:hypothetical protein